MLLSVKPAIGVILLIALLILLKFSLSERIIKSKQELQAIQSVLFWEKNNLNRELYEIAYLKKSFLKDTILFNDSVSAVYDSISTWIDLYEKINLTSKSLPEINLPDIRQFPDSLKNVVLELATALSIVQLKNDLDSRMTEKKSSRIKAIVEGIEVRDSMMSVHIEPYFQFIPNDKYLSVSFYMDDTVITSTPFVWKGELTGLKAEIYNKITLEITYFD